MTLKAEEEAAKRSEGGQRVEAGPWHLRRHEASSSLPPSFLDHHVVLYQRKRINKQVNEQKVEGIEKIIYTAEMQEEKVFQVGTPRQKL